MIRHAKNSDIPKILDLLEQVCMVHHNIRPDLFKGPATKYTEDELKAIIANDQTPVFVCVDEVPNAVAVKAPAGNASADRASEAEANVKEILSDANTVCGASEEDAVTVTNKTEEVKGYAFCIFKQYVNDNILTDIKTLYIDDLCVDETLRGQHIGKELYEYVLQFAREQGCYNVTLNVWAGNDSAIAFYEKRGLKPQKIGMEVIL